jgi:integrase
VKKGIPGMKKNELTFSKLKSWAGSRPQNGEPVKNYDGNGLYVFRSPVGNLSFRYEYQFEGKRRTITFGQYPVMSLAEARQELFNAKRELANGIDPMAKRAKNPEPPKGRLTFKQLSEQFFEHKSKDSSTSKHKNIINSYITRYAFPYIGDMPLSDISMDNILDILHNITKLNLVPTGQKVLRTLNKIFKYGMLNKKGLESNPAYLITGKEIFPKQGTIHRAALTREDDIKRLLLAIDDFKGSLVVKSALRLAPLFFVRSGELTSAEWKEIDFNVRLWRIPAAKMKMAQEHIVPLSTQAIELLTALKEFTGARQYVFSGRYEGQHITPTTLLNALRAMGFGKDEMTVHGFRGLASTRLNELGYNPDWIERQLAHSERNAARAAYNHTDFLKDRTKMMQDWSDYLYDLKAK